MNLNTTDNQENFQNDFGGLNCEEQDPVFQPETIESKNIKLSLIPSKRKRVKKVNIIVEGGFNISTAGLVEENCNKLTQHFDHLSITLKNIEDIDLAALQLLRVLKTSPHFSQKTITIDSELSAENRSMISCAGLMELVSQK